MPNTIARISKTGSLGFVFIYTTERSPVHKTAEVGINTTSSLLLVMPFIFPSTKSPGFNTPSLLLSTTLNFTVLVLVSKIGSIKSTFPLNTALVFVLVVIAIA